MLYYPLSPELSQGYLVEGAPMEPTLKKLRVVLTLATMTETSTLHRECTDLPEAVTSLRKLADEIETELRREPTATHHPSSPTTSLECVDPSAVTATSEDAERGVGCEFYALASRQG